MTIRFGLSCGCGILPVAELDRIRLGGFGPGFWFAQQGLQFVTPQRQISTARSNHPDPSGITASPVAG
ncbi:MAG: hypothetical protein PVJ66_06445 [Gammaproteobacteria bacterium]